jgi:pimeloyl-ACP methyl ester carboxylesterase
MELLADDLIAILDHLQIVEPVTLCGLSMGGYVAWQFWRKYPERLQRLILCDTKAAADGQEASANRFRMAEHVLEHGLEYVAEAMLPKLFATETKQSDPEIVAAVRSMILGTERATIAAAQRGMAERPDVTDWLPQINVPALVLVGVEDEISPPGEMRAIAAALPRSTFVEIPAAGHMAPLENPGMVNQHLVQFLNG